MAKIVAIGGGGLKRAGFSNKSLAIDQEIVRLTCKTNPRVLFVPTASNDSKEYSQSFSEYYARQLGCQVDVLNLTSKPSLADMTSALQTADIIYVGGGNTSRMIKHWRKTGFDRLMVKASQTDKVFAGVSAGAICWFEAGISDSRRYTRHDRRWSYIRIRGLNAIKGLSLHKMILCPHYDTEPRRHTALRRALKHYGKIGIALEECVALEINDGLYRIINAYSSQKAYKAYWRNGAYHLIALGPSELWEPLANLIAEP